MEMQRERRQGGGRQEEEEDGERGGQGNDGGGGIGQRKPLHKKETGHLLLGALSQLWGLYSPTLYFSTSINSPAWHLKKRQTPIKRNKRLKAEYSVAIMEPRKKQNDVFTVL
jgi:hypothetical protein